MKKYNFKFWSVSILLILVISLFSTQLFAGDANTKELCESTALGGVWIDSKCYCKSVKSDNIEITNDNKSCAEILCTKVDDDYKPVGTWNATTKKCTCKEDPEGTPKTESTQVLYEDTGECLYLDDACRKSTGLDSSWDGSCYCGSGLLYLNKYGYCSKAKQDLCSPSGGSWDPGTGCSCNNEAGYYFEYGVCITSRDKCENSVEGALWEPADVSDTLTNRTVGTCKCPAGYLADEGICKDARVVCEGSSGTWQIDDEGVGSCRCKSNKMLKDGRCIPIPESTEKALCEKDGSGVWSPASGTCECMHVDKVWNSSYGCIPNCNSNEVWSGSKCIDASEAADSTKVKCALTKHGNFNLSIIIGMLFTIFSGLILRKTVEKA